MKDTICEVFAGPAKHGIHSASLQKTLYDTERLVLERIPQVTNFYPSSQTLYTVIGEQLALTLSYVISLGHQDPYGAAERPLLCGGLVQISIPSWGQPIQRRGLPAREQARRLHPGRPQPIRFAIKALED